jgi:hypothetical protein
MLGEYGAARERYEEALPLFRRIGDQLGEAKCIGSLGNVYLRLGATETAVNMNKVRTMTSATSRWRARNTTISDLLIDG